MTCEEFEIKVLKPWLEKIGFIQSSRYTIELCDGSKYRLDDQANFMFQKFMVEMAKLKL